MDYNYLSLTYWREQLTRICRVRDVVAARDEVVSDGYTIPSDGDLPIGKGRRIDAAVMFMDICGFSKRLSDTALDQSNNLRVLTFLFSEMIKIVEDYGGIVEKNTGDGLMAYFSESGGKETGDARMRSVACSLTMFNALKKAINPIILASNLEPINFRICIDYGHITIAEVGAPRRFRGIVAIGTTANIASKMLGFAGENTLLLGQDMLQGLPKVWQLKYTQLSYPNSGWVYSANQEQYGFYKYQGRWITPTTT